MRDMSLLISIVHILDKINSEGCINFYDGMYLFRSRDGFICIKGWTNLDGWKYLYRCYFSTSESTCIQDTGTS